MTGTAAGENAAGTQATFVCGSALRFSLRIENGIVEEARIRTNGCGFLIAAAETACQLISGKTLTKLDGLNGFTDLLTEKLDEFPEDRKHCRRLVIDALQSAFRDFRLRQLEEFNGETALICTCFGVSEETIERAVRNGSCATVEEVSEFCRAGSGCGSCQPLIQEIIDGYDILGT